MNSVKVKLLKMTFDKVAGDSRFMASQLVVHMRHQGMQSTCTALQCSEEALYRLGLCKLPAAGSADEAKRLQDAAVYAGVNPRLLVMLLSKLREAPAPLHVAHKLSLEEQWFGHWKRDGHPTVVRLLQQISRVEQALHAQLPHAAQRAAGLAAGIGLALLVNAADVDDSSRYAGQVSIFSDSIGHLAVQDHTLVKLPDKDQIS